MGLTNISLFFLPPSSPYYSVRGEINVGRSLKYRFWEESMRLMTYMRLRTILRNKKVTAVKRWRSFEDRFLSLFLSFSGYERLTSILAVPCISRRIAARSNFGMECVSLDSRSRIRVEKSLPSRDRADQFQLPLYTLTRFGRSISKVCGPERIRFAS